MPIAPSGRPSGQVRRDISLSGLDRTGAVWNDKGRDHSRPLRFSAWRRYQVRRDMPSLSQGFLASMVLARSSIRGRPVLRRFIAGAPFLAGAETRDAGDSIFARDWNSAKINDRVCRQVKSRNYEVFAMSGDVLPSFS
jgi:hypothetical protein